MKNIVFTVLIVGLVLLLYFAGASSNVSDSDYASSEIKISSSLDTDRTSRKKRTQKKRNSTTIQNDKIMDMAFSAFFNSLPNMNVSSDSIKESIANGNFEFKFDDSPRKVTKRKIKSKKRKNLGKGSVSTKASSKYYCPQGDPRYSFSSNDVYDPTSNCESWKDEFWQKRNPELYNNCVNRLKRQKQMKDSGKCSPVAVKVHKFGNTVCNLEVSEKYQKIISQSCSGSNIDAAEQSLRTIYYGW